MVVSGFGPSSTPLLKFMRVSEYRGTKIGTGSAAEGFLRVPVNLKKPDCFHFRATSQVFKRRREVELKRPVRESWVRFSGEKKGGLETTVLY